MSEFRARYHAVESRLGILEAPVLDTPSFATRCPASAPGTTLSRAVWAILEAPFLGGVSGTGRDGVDGV